MAVAEIVSLTKNTTTNGTKHLSKFQYSSLHPTIRPPLFSIKFDEHGLENFLKVKLPLLDFKVALPDLITKLTELRCILYSIKWVKAYNWNEKVIQFMMILFLNYMFETYKLEIIALVAINDPIELTVTDGNDIELEWTGRKDIKCCRKVQISTDEANTNEIIINEAVDERNINNAFATLTVKVTFNSTGSTLYKSRALQAKQQLFGDAMGLNQQSGQPGKLSYLTDLVAIAVMYYQDGAYLSECATDAKAYCLRLLLMCCGDISSEEWSQITTNVGPVDLSDIKHQTNNGVNNSEEYDWYLNDDEDAHERWLEDVADIYRWEAKCQGCAYLGYEEMWQHNAITN